jgi:hypothetical protein
MCTHANIMVKNAAVENSGFSSLCPSLTLLNLNPMKTIKKKKTALEPINSQVK